MQNLGKHSALLVAGGLLSALLLFYLPWLAGEQSFFVEDLTDFFHPLCSFVGDALRQGRLPLWNPYSYCGMSQAAISSPGMFYPPNWLFAVLDFNRAMATVLLISQFMCGFGMFLLVRDFNWEWEAAAIAGITAALTGYMFSMAHNYTLVCSAAWIPMVLFCIRRVVRTAGAEQVRWMGALASSLFMHVVAGRPEISAPGLVLALAFAGYEISRAEREQHAEAAGNLLKAFILGALLSMPSVLPLLEWMPWSRRSEGLLASEVLMYSANWFDFIQMMVSHPFGELMMRGSKFHPLVIPNNLEPYYGSAFIGAPVIAFALMGVTTRGGALYKLGIAALIAAIIGSLGEHMPGAGWLVEHVPALSILRFPCKYMIFAVFITALFAGRGIHLYKHQRARLVAPAVFFGLTAAWALVAIFTQHGAFPFYQLPSIDAATYAAAQNTLGIRLLVASATGGVVLLVLRLLRNREKCLGLAAIGIVLGVLLANAFIHYRFGAPPDFFERPSFAAQRLANFGGENERMIALYLERFTVPPQLTKGSPLENTVAAFQYRRQALRPFANMDFDIPSAFGFEGSMVGEYYYLLSNSYVASSQWAGRFDPANRAAPPNDKTLARLLRCSATHFAITQVYRFGAPVAPYLKVPPLDPQHFEHLVEDEPNNLRIYKVKDALPHVYLSYGWQNLDSRDAVIDALSSVTSSFDPSNTTLVESKGDVPASTSQAAIQPVRAIDQPAPEHIRVKIKPDKQALLVLADQYYPGWHALVDGQPVTIRRCNGFFRGVFVPAGEHTVEFNYEPDSIKYGLILAGIAILWWCALQYGSRMRTNKA